MTLAKQVFKASAFSLVLLEFVRVRDAWGFCDQSPLVAGDLRLSLGDVR